MVDMDVNILSGFIPPFRISDPVLRYRLDPCEPGMLRSAHASQSVAAVSAHERGNLNQFRREAALAGRMVVHESITFTRGIDGLFSSVRAGRTEVVSVPLPEDELFPPIDEESHKLPQMQLEVDDAGDEDIKDILDDELELLNILSTIRRQLEENKASGESASRPSSELWQPPGSEQDMLLTGMQPEAEESGNGVWPYIDDEDAVTGNPKAYSPESPNIEQAPDEYGHVQLKAENADIQEEIREIQHKLNELMIRRISTNISELNEVLSGAIRKNIDMASKLMKVANHVGPDSHFPDVSSSVPFLGNTIDFSM